MSGAPLLELAGVEMRFGGIRALAGVSFAMQPGQICGLIGPNGSGKTTLFNCISGIYRTQAGEIRFNGRPLLALPRHRMAALGIARTFQNVALFRSMTVRDNVLAGAHTLGRTGFLANALRLGAVARETAELERRLAETLALLDLQDVADRLAATLPFGTQKRVELARALIAAPRLLLLDEPAGGLNHGDVDALGDLLLRIRARLGLGFLLVEHHMALVMRVSDKVVALEFGRCIADGTPAEVQRAPEVIRAYLGEGAHDRVA